METIRKLEEERFEVARLGALNISVEEQISHLKRKTIEQEQLISLQSTNIYSLQQQISSLTSQHQILI